jgi:hypothetical protein
MKMNPIELAKTVVRNKNVIFSTKKRIGYIGWLGHNNLGDEAMYLSFKKMFPEFNMFPFKTTDKIRLFEDLMRKSFFEAVFIGGGTLIGSGEYLAMIKSAQKDRVPSFTFGVGVRNPLFWGMANKKNANIGEWVEVLQRCRYVSVRGPVSKEILDNHGYLNADITGDPALYFGRNIIKRKKKNKILGINIGVSDGNVWGGRREY